MKETLILVSNDDGIQAPGIHALALMASRHGHVVVVAPDGPRSGQAASLTVNIPVGVKRVDFGMEDDPIEWYSCTGTPTDCIKLALTQILDRKPDIVISGINHGSNASVNVLYSGTIGAAQEGTMHDLPAIAFSISDHSEEADLSHCLPYFEQILTRVLQHGLPHEVLLNVNTATGPRKGIRICRQASGRWANDFTPDNAPRQTRYFWMVGDFFNTEKGDPEADQVAIDEGYVAVVPVRIDRTDYDALAFLKQTLI